LIFLDINFFDGNKRGRRKIDEEKKVVVEDRKNQEPKRISIFPFTFFKLNFTIKFNFLKKIIEKEQNMKLNIIMSCLFYKRRQRHFQNLRMQLNQNLRLNKMQTFECTSKGKEN